MPARDRAGKSAGEHEGAAAALSTLTRANVGVAEEVVRAVARAGTLSRAELEWRPVTVRLSRLVAVADGIAGTAVGAFVLLAQAAAVVGALGDSCDCGCFGHGGCCL